MLLIKIEFEMVEVRDDADHEKSMPLRHPNRTCILGIARH